MPQLRASGSSSARKPMYRPNAAVRPVISSERGGESRNHEGFVAIGVDIRSYGRVVCFPAPVPAVSLGRIRLLPDSSGLAGEDRVGLRPVDVFARPEWRLSRAGRPGLEEGALPLDSGLSAGRSEVFPGAPPVDPHSGALGRTTGESRGWR